MITTSLENHENHEMMRMRDCNFVLLSDITNGSSHMHPWLATALSLIFLAFIVFVIMFCGDNAE